MNTSRRTFIGTLTATSLAGCATWRKEEKALTIGFMTDTHVLQTRESCARVEGAYKVFKREGCDVIVNAGDIADWFYPKGYKHYRDIANETYPDPNARPQEIFVYANHDTLHYPRKPGETKWDAFPHVKKLLQIPNDPWDVVKVKGYTFVVVPQSLDYDRYEKTIAEACAANPGKHVFLCDHLPGGGTTVLSSVWGDSRRRKVLNKYPQVVALTGHIHGSLRDPRQVWHGEYTCVNGGCLQAWHGDYFGISPSSKREYGVFVIDVYPSKLVFRRYDVRTGEAFDPEPMDAVERVRGELWRKDAAGEWRVFAVKDVEYPFYLPPSERKPVESVEFHPACFDEGVPYRITLTPLDFNGRRGETRVVEEGVGRACPGGEVVYKSDDPMHEMQFMYGLEGGDPVPVKDGFYDYSGRNARLVFPKSTWDGPAGTRFRYVLDMTTEQGERRSWSMTMRNPKPVSNGHNRLYTMPGKQGSMRYVAELKKSYANYDYYLLFREGPAGRVRFDRVRVERLDVPGKRQD